MASNSYTATIARRSLGTDLNLWLAGSGSGLILRHSSQVPGPCLPWSMIGSPWCVVVVQVSLGQDIGSIGTLQLNLGAVFTQNKVAEMYPEAKQPSLEAQMSNGY